MYGLSEEDFKKRFHGGTKYWKVNIVTPYNTVEFRQLASTFRSAYVVAWSQLVIRFVCIARALGRDQVFAHVANATPLHTLVGEKLYDDLRSEARLAKIGRVDV